MPCPVLHQFSFLYPDTIKPHYLNFVYILHCRVDRYRGYGATTPLHLGHKLAGPLCTAFSSARQPQRRSMSSNMRALQ